MALVFGWVGGVRGGDSLRVWGEYYARVLSGAESGATETGVQMIYKNGFSEKGRMYSLNSCFTKKNEIWS